MKRLISLLPIVILALALLLSCATSKETSQVRALRSPAEKAARIDELSIEYISSTNATEMHTSLQIANLPIDGGSLSYNFQSISSIHQASETASLYTKTVLSRGDGDSPSSTVFSTDLVYNNGTMYISSNTGTSLGYRLRGNVGYEDFIAYICGEELFSSDVSGDLTVGSITVEEGRTGDWTVAYKGVTNDTLEAFNATIGDLIEGEDYSFSEASLTVRYSRDFKPSEIEYEFCILGEEGEELAPVRLIASAKYYNSSAPARSCSVIERQKNLYREVDALSTVLDLYGLMEEIKAGEHPQVYSQFTSTPYLKDPSISTERLKITDTDKLEFEITRSTGGRAYRFVYKDGMYSTVSIINGIESELDRVEMTRTEAGARLDEWLNPISASLFQIVNASSYENEVHIALPASVLAQLSISSYYEGSQAYYKVHLNEEGEIDYWRLIIEIGGTYPTKMEYIFSFEDSVFSEVETPVIPI